ncbi:16855_t:CDS:1 [Acaulospora morrowiae]|uniref:16855_t:CDS:1 n=1 Tax=Acaulospora morrowiae TaxID=94023 RepID=A0A9N9G438_9GLOM|nr:16855_t:CDS:1 [Acaulospora morrowiae]
MKNQNSSFPTFLLYEILLDFHDDRKILYSCILVSRAWCRAIIHLLWRNPMKLIHGSDDYYPYHRYRSCHVKLVDTYLRHLNDDERMELSKKGFPLFGAEQHTFPIFNYISFLRYLSNSDLQMISLFWCLDFEANNPRPTAVSPIRRFPLFKRSNNGKNSGGSNKESLISNGTGSTMNYMSGSNRARVTCRFTNMWSIVRKKFGKKSRVNSSTISSLIFSAADDYYTADILLKSEIIHHVLSKLIAEQCQTIKYLQSTSTLLGSSDDDTRSLLKHPRIRECLSNLTMFESRSNFYRGTSFEVLSEICQGLRTIEVSSCNPLHLPNSEEEGLEDDGDDQAILESQKLCRLIKAQAGLREFILWNCKIGIFDIVTHLVSSQQNSLRVLSFNHCDFQNSNWLENLSEFSNLESLTFNQCTNFSDQIPEKLFLPSIRRLKFIYGQTQPTVLTTLIEAAKDSLMDLDTGVPHFRYNWMILDHRRKINFLESDYYNHLNILGKIELCKNLTSLTTYIHIHTQEQLFNALLNLDRLQKLVLTEIPYCSNETEQRYLMFSNFFPALGSHLSPTLRLLHIGTKFGIKKRALTGFKKNCLSRFRKVGVFGGLDWDMKNQKVEFEGIFDRWNIDDIKGNFVPNYGVLFSV